MAKLPIYSDGETGGPTVLIVQLMVIANRVKLKSCPCGIHFDGG
jgi:hypothetical protein